MDSNKPQELGIIVSILFCLKKIFQKGRLALLCLSKHIMTLFYQYKFMLITLFSGLLMRYCTKNYAKCMQSEFEMSMMGELNFFLGLQIKQSSQKIFIYQAKYTKYLLKKFEMDNAKSIVTPMAISTKLDLDENGKPIDISNYRGMIGSLLYLSTNRPNRSADTIGSPTVISQPICGYG